MRVCQANGPPRPKPIWTSSKISERVVAAGQQAQARGRSARWRSDRRPRTASARRSRRSTRRSRSASSTAASAATSAASSGVVLGSPKRSTIASVAGGGTRRRSPTARSAPRRACSTPGTARRSPRSRAARTACASTGCGWRAARAGCGRGSCPRRRAPCRVLAGGAVDAAQRERLLVGLGARGGEGDVRQPGHQVAQRAAQLGAPPRSRRPRCRRCDTRLSPNAPSTGPAPPDPRRSRRTRSRSGSCRRAR